MAWGKASDEVNPLTAQARNVVRGIVSLVEHHGEALDMSAGEFPDAFDGATDGSGEDCCVVFGASVEFVDERQAQPLDDGNRQAHLTEVMMERLVGPFR